MLTLQTRLCLNSAEVAAKILDGEAILIDLSDGMYYSLDLAGALVWEGIEARRRLSEIAAELGARYEVSTAQAEADVLRLCGELLDRRLALESVEGPAAPWTVPDPSPRRSTYEPPRLNAYHDMADLLALDPPHPALSETLSKFSDRSGPA